jgi:hypothetical protein
MQQLSLTVQLKTKYWKLPAATETEFGLKDVLLEIDFKFDFFCMQLNS